MSLRDYQVRGLAEIEAALASDARRVLAVAPTGAGKGTMAATLMARAVQQGKRALFLVHRREIVLDVARRVQTEVGREVGLILPGKRPLPDARVQVASVQSLLRPGCGLPQADLIVPDEAHHYAADEWRGVLEAYQRTPMVGFTATPQRADGRAMGDVFERLVVVVGYAELIKAGHIVGCDVLRPPHRLGIDLAQEPVAAYQRYANGRPALVYMRRVHEAMRVAKAFGDVRVAAAVVHAKTPKAERDETMRKLGDGSLTVVVNVYALTEGVDVPRVSAIVLARTCDHASTYVQIVGRGLRAHHGKKRALLLDLTGVSHKHGLPTDDRAYSLDGSGMGEPVERELDGAERVMRQPKVLGLDLVGVAQAAEDAGPDPKRARWDELAAKISAQRLTVDEALGAYRQQFGERSPWASMLAPSIKEGELARLQQLTRGSGMREAFASAKYHEQFGEWPKQGEGLSRW